MTMESKRILNRIIFINIANTDYSSAEIAGNTCFVGTNNMGKTTLQRAILFFYSANTRGLGISGSQKSFEDYYFQYPNSYIIYEILTEEGMFHVMIYRHNKLLFRFVESPFNKDLYIVNNEAVLPKEVLTRFNENKLYYSDQIETFERYRNIIYGADPDKRYKKFALLKGNSNYHNIPLAITSIFLSSEASIKAEFVKECIANSISTKHTNIELKTVERQLRQFTEKYQDIETFFRKENAQRGELIKDNFSQIKNLKTKQRALAAELGGAIKYATEQKDLLGLQVANFRQKAEALTKDFKWKENAFQEKKGEINQEIGAIKSRLKEADKKQKEYQGKGIEDLLKKADEKAQLLASLQARETEYSTLTAGFKDVEQQYKTLFDGLENEKKEFLNMIASQGLSLERKFQEVKSKLAEEFRKNENSLREKHASATDQFKGRLHKKELDKQKAEFSEKEIKKKKYFEREIALIKENLDEIGKRRLDREAQSKIKNREIESLRKEAEHIKEKNKITAEQFTSKNKEEIALIDEKIKAIEEKLSVHQNAFFGFLQENYPEWHKTIGKVCNEELLFSKDLNPKLIQKELDSLYGIQLDLANVKIHSKSLEEYEQEKSTLLQEKSVLNQNFLDFREAQAREEQSKLASIGKKSAQFKNELSQLDYDAEQDEQKEKQFTLDLNDWERKAESQREQDLTEVYTLQEELKKELAEINASMKGLAESLKDELKLLKNKEADQLSEAKKDYDDEAAVLEESKDSKLEELNERREQLQKDKSKSLKNKGIDDSKIKTLENEIKSIKQGLDEIEKNAELVNDYKKDKRELFDKVESFNKEKEILDEKIKQCEKDFSVEKQSFDKDKIQLEKESSKFLEELKKYSDGLDYFEKHFKEKALFERLRHLIEPATAMPSDLGITALCSQLFSNDGEYHGQFEKFRNKVTEFTGRFRPENHLNFRINTNANEFEYERFAEYLQEFYNENKIQTSIAEVAKNHGMLIDAIATKVKALTDHKGRINRMISKMEADFGRASFESSKLIEYIKLKSEDSENKVLKKLQKIAEFREQNPFLYGESNLFNQENKAKSEIDKKSVELLNDLQKTISEENYDEIKVQDLFELRFRIKEGKNDTGWIEKIDRVGSTGTDMLVKAVIYITLLNVFIKESTEKTAQNFKVHCIIDEVGQISAPYLKELISFAEERNIYLINGLPNESKLETHYNYTYKFRKDQHGNVKVVPLLTMSIEP